MRSYLGSLLLLSAFSIAISSAGRTQSENNAESVVIIPGQSVGPLRLGDTGERAFELFPFKANMDQEWRESGDCGTTFNWLDLKKQEMAGNIFIRFKEGKVFQIDSGTTRFHTTKGISVRSSPQEIRKQYPGLRAYVLSEGTSEAEGGRPLVYWIDSGKGIAFAFAYGRRKHRWYLNWIIAFEPHKEVCPQYAPLEPSDRRELAPYSLKPE